MRFSFLLISLFLINNLVQAQDTNLPWQISLGTNAIDPFPVGVTKGGDLGPQGKLMEDFFNFNDHWNFGGLNISFSRFISGGLTVGVEGAINALNKIEGNKQVDIPYYSFDAFFKYRLFYNKKINPYLIGGYGFTRFDTAEFLTTDLSSQISKAYFFGFGLNYNIKKEFSIFFESNYRTPTDVQKTNHFQHLLGFNYNFSFKLYDKTPPIKNNNSDKDNDGIIDEKDLCPDVFGLAQFNGCPDTDGDGVIDILDSCIELKGSPDQDGCPDSDTDGVPDNKDLCPKIAGLIEFKGCPDSDKDGIQDSLDVCPDVFGTSEFSGCPDNVSALPSDTITTEEVSTPKEDLINTNDNQNDESTEEITPVDAESEEEIETKNVHLNLNALGLTIIFPEESATLLGRKNQEVLTKIKDELVKYPNLKIGIQGFSSSSKDEQYKSTISKNRAISVRDHLIKIGLPANRLVIMRGEDDDSVNKESLDNLEAQKRSVQFRIIN